MLSYITAVIFLLVIVAFCVAAIGLNFVRHQGLTSSEGGWQAAENAARTAGHREISSHSRLLRKGAIAHNA